MKSITPVISIVLLILITIIASASAFFFVNSSVLNLESQGSLSLFPGSDSSRLNLVSITGSKAIVRNDGNSPVTEMVVFINGEMFNYVLDEPLLPGQLKEINYAAQPVGEDLELKIIYNLGKSVTDDSPAKYNTVASGFVTNTVPVAILASIAENATHLKGYCQASVYNTSIESIYYYQWLFDSAVYSSGNVSGNHDNENYLLNIVVSAEGTWKFKCLISNGTFNSSWAESSEAIIGGEVIPEEIYFLTANNASIVQQTYGLQGYCNATSSNINDLLRFNYTWKVNGAQTINNIKFKQAVDHMGGFHSCGLLANGSALCWGYNSIGEIGNGSMGGKSTVPSFVIGNYIFSSISPGIYHTCGLLANGSALCWGENDYGQIGNGIFYETPPYGYPTPIFVSGNYNFSSILAGSRISCGLLTNGSAVCWGRGTYGSLGYGGTDNQNIPIFVSGNYNFSSISAGLGGAHSCGLLINGSAVCWGLGSWGRLGNGGETNSNIPVFVSGNYKFSNIIAGGQHSCGILSNGSAVCWGDNTYSQLGNGSEEGISTIPVFVSGNYNYSSLSLGSWFSCGLLSNGSAVCWGLGSSGQLGDGNVDYSSSTPVFALGDYIFSSIGSGGAHSCGVLTNGSMMCWGENDYGQLGDGSTARGEYPIFVSSLYSYIDNNYYWNKDSFISLLPSSYYTYENNITFNCQALNYNNASAWKESEAINIAAEPAHSPDDTLIYCLENSSNNIWFTGSSTGSNSPCCGDDGASDIFYNGSIGTTNNFCQAGNYIHQAIDFNKTVCNYYYPNKWFNSNFSFSSPVQLTSGANIGVVGSGDFNNDGNSDIIVIESSTSQFAYFEGFGNGSFKPLIYHVFGMGVDSYGIGIGDFNNDGNLDVLNSDNGDPSKIIYSEGYGNGSFKPSVPYTAGRTATDISVGDFNNDGNLDAVVAQGYITNAGFSYFQGNGDGTFDARVDYSTGNCYGVASGDFDKDGNLDVIASSTGTDQMAYFRGYGNGTFYPKVLLTANDYPTHIFVDDVNNDNNLDFIVTHTADYVFCLFKGNGDGTFAAKECTATGLVPNYPFLGDLNNDGNLDLLISSNSRLNYYEGYGNGSFAPVVYITVGTYNKGITLSDFDNDSDLDAAVASEGDGGSSNYLNNTGIIGINGPCCGDDGASDTFTNSTYYCCNGVFHVGSC